MKTRFWKEAWVPSYFALINYEDIRVPILEANVRVAQYVTIDGEWDFQCFMQSIPNDIYIYTRIHTVAPSQNDIDLDRISRPLSLNKV